MALQELHFTILCEGELQTIPEEWSHTGVVGSGDMEVLLTHRQLDGVVEAIVRTPVTGFDDIWKRVVEQFVIKNSLGNLVIEINDNNATPYIVSMRLQQALIEAQGGGGL